jgi:hypothetical protein
MCPRPTASFAPADPTIQAQYPFYRSPTPVFSLISVASQGVRVGPPTPVFSLISVASQGVEGGVRAGVEPRTRSPPRLRARAKTRARGEV